MYITKQKETQRYREHRTIESIVLRVNYITEMRITMSKMDIQQQ